KLHRAIPPKRGYGFAPLTQAVPEWSSHTITSPKGEPTINFPESEAVRVLNQALLADYYGVKFWQIPDGYLCPPIPGRADYIHYIADLLAEDNEGVIPTGNKINVLDIGVGANCIYPLLGNREYGWKFTGSDVDEVAIKSAQSIAKKNSLLDVLTFKKQNNKENIFSGVISTGDYFHLTVSNPPFHTSLTEATLGTQRKWKNLGEEAGNRNTLNFGGKNNELWYK